MTNNLLRVLKRIVSRVMMFKNERQNTTNWYMLLVDTVAFGPIR